MRSTRGGSFSMARSRYQDLREPLVERLVLGDTLLDLRTDDWWRCVGYLNPLGRVPQLDDAAALPVDRVAAVPRLGALEDRTPGVPRIAHHVPHGCVEAGERGLDRGDIRGDVAREPELAARERIRQVCVVVAGLPVAVGLPGRAPAPLAAVVTGHLHPPLRRNLLHVTMLSEARVVRATSAGYPSASRSARTRIASACAVCSSKAGRRRRRSPPVRTTSAGFAIASVKPDSGEREPIVLRERAGRDVDEAVNNCLAEAPAAVAVAFIDASERERQIHLAHPFSHDRSFKPCFLEW